MAINDIHDPLLTCAARHIQAPGCGSVAAVDGNVGLLNFGILFSANVLGPERWLHLCC